MGLWVIGNQTGSAFIYPLPALHSDNTWGPPYLAAGKDKADDLLVLLHRQSEESRLGMSSKADWFFEHTVNDDKNTLLVEHVQT